MAAFKPTKILSNQKAEERLTSDEIYWKRLQTVAVLQGPGLVSNIDFSLEPPYNFAASRSFKVEIYDHNVCEIVSSVTRFKSPAYGAVFRNDGQLLAAGSEDGQVQIFNVKSTIHSAIRVFNAHNSGVHACKFSCDGRRVVSFGDDKSVKGSSIKYCWDIASTNSSAPVISWDQHNDHVRCGATGWMNEHLILSGSYDHSAKVFDSRQKGCVISVKHGFPIEDILLFPSEALFATAGGTVVKVWDMVAGTEIAHLNQHHKTVTSVKLAAGSSRLLTAGLDKHLKVYDIKTFQQLHSMSYSGSILSMGISKDDSVVAVGMAVGGLLSIERRRPDKISKPATSNPLIFHVPEESRTESSTTSVVCEKEPAELRRYDQYLRKFQHARALSYVVSSKYFSTRRPEVVISLIKELSRRGALEKALAGRDSASLAPVLRFIAKHLSEQRFTRVLTGTTMLILDIYEKEWPVLDRSTVNLFKKLRDAVRKEVNQQKEMRLLLGSVAIILSQCNVKKQNLPENSFMIFGHPIVERMTFDYNE